MKQTCILVLGMHRSGTSALTGVLSLLDIYLGSELMKANFANKKGYFENNILYKINESLLSQINSAWDDVFYDENKLENITELSELKKAIKKEFEYADIFAIKDPRLVFLFPIYKKVLEELKIDIKIILPYRNPIEVANSLSKRNNMPLEKGMLLWAYHFLLAEKFSRGFERVFVGFDELISNTTQVLDEISIKLSTNLNEKYYKNKALVNEFLEPSLKHHNISIENLSANTPKIVKEVLSLKENFNDIDLSKEFDILRNELFSYQKLFYNSDIINTLNEIQSSKEQLTQKDKELSSSKEQLTQKEQAIANKDKELTQTKETLTQKEQAIANKDKELSSSKEQLTQKDKELSGSKEQLTQKDKVIQNKNQEIEALKDELVLIYDSKSWKVTRMLRKFRRYIK